MRTAINSFFVIFVFMGLIFSCETDEVIREEPDSFFEINGKKTELSEAFMDVVETSNGKYIFEIYLLGDGLSFNLADEVYEEDGDILRISLVQESALLPSGTSSYLFADWSDQPEPNTFIYSSLSSDCTSAENCNGNIHLNMMDGSIQVKKVSSDYDIEFTLMFTDVIIEGRYAGSITRRD